MCNITIKDRERLLKIHEQDKKHVDELARERDILNKNFLKDRVLRIITSKWFEHNRPETFVKPW